jgi:hypothetical protein
MMVGDDVELREARRGGTSEGDRGERVSKGREHDRATGTLNLWQRELED